MIKKICFISDNPSFLGGISLYTKNIIKYLKTKNPSIELTWVFKGGENKKFYEKGINYVEFKIPKTFLLEEIIFNEKVKKFLKTNNFEIISSHALWGYWMKSYRKKRYQKLVHTYHGVTYNFYKNHLKRFNLLKKAFASFLLLYGFIIEKPPIKKADKIICVSGHVKKELERLYGLRDKMFVIRTGVDLNQFKKRSKKELYSKLGLDKDKFYGLYVGRGGFWTKGLDRAVNLSKEIHTREKNFRLLVIGPDYQKVKNLVDKEFIIFPKDVPREKMPLYYSASEMFFCMSRYEGGAPTLVVSEAMASKCLLICSKDSQQEIINDGVNGVIISSFKEDSAKKILSILKNKSKLNKIKKEGLKTINKISLENWGKEIVKKLGTLI